MANPIDLQKHLSGVSYPAGKNDLIATAQRNGADDQLLGALNKLPDKQFSGPDQVQKAIF
jgi:Protein of unknown function (DUF2795)